MLKVSFPAGTSTYYTSTAGRPASAYYTDEATLCEPAGVWWGSGAAALGLAGVVDADLAEALFDRLIDVRDPLSRARATWDEAATLGRAPGRYRAAEHIEAQMLAAEPDATPERREVIRIEAGMRARTARTFIDATYSPVKSVSLLHIAAVREASLATTAGDTQAAAVWQWVRDEIEDAVRTANVAALEYLADHGGYTRAGHHGGAGGRWVDAHDLSVATFFQYSTRAGDPGLHCHNLILNRVQDAEGKWRALDSACLIAAQHGAGAVADRVLETELGRRLGVDYALRESGVSREIVGTTETMIEAVSRRSADIATVARPLLDAYEERLGRPATALERRRILDQVAARTRARKDANHLESPQQRAARIEAQISEQVGMNLATMADALLASARTGTPEAQPFSPESIIKEALARVSDGQAVWSRHQVTRHILTLLPPLGALTPQEVRHLAESLTDQALAMPTYGDHRGPILGATSEYGAVSVSGSIPAYVPTTDRLANGQSAYQRPGAQRYATSGSRQAEDALRAAAITEAGRTLHPTLVRGWLAHRAQQGLRLSEDQAQAVEAILTGRQQLSILIGPAGTGKSRVASVLAEAWTDPTLNPQDTPAGQMIGLAISQNAANILAKQGMTALNVERWLGAQRRITAGTPNPGDQAYRLTTNDLVLVDEASMLDTVAADEIRQCVQAAGARWIWAGDHRQLGAIGAGGMMADLAGSARTFELSTVHRMREDWERAASLRLRDGDVAVLADYERHGRIRACDTLAHAETDAVRGWLADTIAGMPSVVIVGTNDQAARLSIQCRNHLVAYGRVAEDGVHLPRQSAIAGIGDIVVTRTNHRHLADTTGQPAEVWNRDRWRVAATSSDGSLTVTPADGSSTRHIVLPNEYVAASVELGYATNEYGVQSQTITRAHVARAAGGSLQALYVDLTRTTEHTIVYVPTRPDGGVADGQTHQTPTRTATAVLAEFLERDQADQAAVTVAEEELQQHTSARTLVERYTAVADQATATRLAETLTLLASTAAIPDHVPAAIAADDSRTQLAWLLRRIELAGHDPEQALTAAITQSSLHGARSIAQVIHGRIIAAHDGQTTPTPVAMTDRIPTAISREARRALGDLATLIDQRRHDLGTEVADTQPAWALTTLGPVPADPVERLEWETRAGRIALHREVADHTDPAQPIARCPAPGLVDQVAIWHDAWSALGRPEAIRAEAQMSDGRLLVRVRAGELAEAQAPAYVGEQLRTAATDAVTHEQDAILTAARANLTDDVEQREAIRAAAADSQDAAEHAEDARIRLTEVDDARRIWLEANATTLAHAETARAELRERGIDPQHEPDRVTATEWLQADQAARAEDDPHRPITETDLAESTEAAQSSTSDSAAVDQRSATAASDTTRTDQANPPADDIDHQVAEARAALTELADRRSAEAARGEREASEQAERSIAWHRSDQAQRQEQQDVDVR